MNKEFDPQHALALAEALLKGFDETAMVGMQYTYQNINMLAQEARDPLMLYADGQIVRLFRDSPLQKFL
jgi:hypothetical protein